MKPLTPRRSRFVEEYLVDLNGTQAAIRAGYSTKGADVMAAQLLGNPRVRGAVDTAIARRATRLQVTQDRVVLELARIAYSDVRQAFDDKGRLLPMQELPEDIARVISGVEVDQLFDGTGEDRYHAGDTMKVKLWEKTKALELLGKHLKMFTDKIDMSGELSVRVVKYAIDGDDNA